MRGAPQTGLAGSARGSGHQFPADPRAILTSIGETVYDWDLATDVIAWSANAADVLGRATFPLSAPVRPLAFSSNPARGRTVTRRFSALPTRIREAASRTAPATPSA